MKRLALFVILICVGFTSLTAQHTVARQWNEVLLQAIRDDQARPTVHARNLFHSSVAMYDAWAAYDQTASPFFLGQLTGDYYCPYSGLTFSGDVKAEREKAISYAAYHLIKFRFTHSPGVLKTWRQCDSLMDLLGYDRLYSSLDYLDGDGAALGNYLAQSLIDFGLQDGSNERNLYANKYYQPANPPLDPRRIGGFMVEPDRWQPLAFDLFIDQSGVQSSGVIPAFLGPEWGNVVPFALTDADRSKFCRNGFPYQVYDSPGPPPSISDSSGDYQWNFGLVAWWSSHLDPSDSVKWDISPAAFGNISDLPVNKSEWRNFYDAFEGGDPGQGRPLNPATGQPYAPNVVYRGDYTRVLAEFWADGPDSETPPGHWFTLLNYVNDHPAFVRKYKGQGQELDPLEWDVKSYFSLGGAMHDAAVAAWSIKGWFDYVRPISAIRYMASLGQRSDPSANNYHPYGFDLVPGLVETVDYGDELAGDFDQHVGKIKIFGWRGPEYIPDPSVNDAGVGWILAENWWPYQRPTFVTPPFAGYVSGHSTFSRAAAEVLTEITGDPFFPGGMGEFVAKKNEFLVFEEGPSQDVVLQWATYRDASDQTSLSRIWGGIHPPCDDIPGRLIGEKIGRNAFALADQYFSGSKPTILAPEAVVAFPNPLEIGRLLNVKIVAPDTDGEAVFADLQGRELARVPFRASSSDLFVQFSTDQLPTGIYVVSVRHGDKKRWGKVLVQ